jgi:hypothetical protein
MIEKSGITAGMGCVGDVWPMCGICVALRNWRRMASFASHALHCIALHYMEPVFISQRRSGPQRALHFMEDSELRLL